jgi:hypothetical protein
VSEIKLPKNSHSRYRSLYLDFKKPPFPNRLSHNAEVLRQSGMKTAGCTQTAGRTAATAGYLLFSKWRPPMVNHLCLDKRIFSAATSVAKVAADYDFSWQRKKS